MTVIIKKYIHTRIEPEIRNEAEKIFKRLGLNLSQAVRIFLLQTIEKRGLPFDLKEVNHD